MMDNKLMERFLSSGELPSKCPYLRSYYCLVGGKCTKCPNDVVLGEFYTCENSVFVSYYNRLLNERVRV